mgnify:CR=1 FL=1
MQFHGCVQDPVQGLGLVVPRMKGSLDSLLQSSESSCAPDPSQRVLFAHLSAMSVMALHEMGICHQDIKSHNFLYDGGTVVAVVFASAVCLWNPLARQTDVSLSLSLSSFVRWG